MPAATFIAQTEQLSFRRRRRHSRADAARRDVFTLGAGKRWIEAGTQGAVLSILRPRTITGPCLHTVPSAMAKSAILAMTRSLAVEWGPKGIPQVAIARPGAFPTRARRVSFGQKAATKAGPPEIRSAASANR